MLASLKRKPIRRCGSQLMNSSSPTMPPRIVTVRVVPTPNGCGLVHSTLVMTVAQRGHALASSSAVQICSGVALMSTAFTRRTGAVSTHASSTWSQGKRRTRVYLPCGARDHISPAEPIAVRVGTGQRNQRGGRVKADELTARLAATDLF